MIGRQATVSLALAIALGAGWVSVARVAHAQAAPTAEQLAQAKKAYGEGKAFFASGKYDKAVDKFKESYRLSRRPTLLYNIGLTFDKLGTKDMALFYYKKFLSDAPDNDPSRPEAEKSVATLEKDTQAASGDGDTTAAPPDGAGDGGGSGSGDTTATPPDGSGDGSGSGSGDTTAPPPDDTEKPKPKKTKPKRTAAATADDFQHTVIDEAPPGKPLDLTANVPDDAGWEVILFYRGAGDTKFVAEPMKPRYHDLVGRIPAAKMAGNAVQYYIEVKDADGQLVTRAGKATSPNVIFLDPSAKARYFPDVDDPDSGTSDAAIAPSHDDDDNPLGGGHTAGTTTVTGPTPPAPEGAWGVGTSRYRDLKWAATGAGGVSLTLSVTFYFMASSWSKSLEAEASISNSMSCTGGAPCRPYDDYRNSIQTTGKRYQTISRVFLVTGLVTGAVAGYVWYHEHKAHHGEHHAAPATGLSTLTAMPVASDGFLGGTAALRF